MCIKSHDCVNSSDIRIFPSHCINIQMLQKPSKMQLSTRKQSPRLGNKTPNQRLARMHCRRGCSAKRRIILNEFANVQKILLARNYTIYLIESAAVIGWKE